MPAPPAVAADRAAPDADADADLGDGGDGRFGRTLVPDDSADGGGGDGAGDGAGAGDGDDRGGGGLLTGLRSGPGRGPLRVPGDGAAGGLTHPDGGDDGDTDVGGRTVQLAPDGDDRDADAPGRGGPPLPVRVVGEEPTADYRPGEVLGEGGTGVVREAVQVALGRTVALKTLKPAGRRGRGTGGGGSRDGRAGGSAGGRGEARFLAEARVTAGLDHPNILPVYELARDEGGEPFLAMKRVVGTPWSASVRTMTRRENLRILGAVADAVAFAHSRGVVHRDVKPENVLLGAFGEVLLTDWGLALTEEDRAAARAAQDAQDAGESPDASAPGKVSAPAPGRLGGGVDASGVAGTPAYMAPEQARGDAAALGPATDVYLLGAALFEIATGRRPHRGSSLSECLASAAENRLDLRPGDAPPDIDLDGVDPDGGDPAADPCEELIFAADGENCDDLDDAAATDREVRAAADVELVRIARAAMADDPADRPPGVRAFKELLAEFETRAASAELTRRGRELAAEARDTGDYAAFGLAARTLAEAADVWPGNDCARQALRTTRAAFAQLACDRGDLELAESLVAVGDLRDDPVADRCLQLRREQTRQAEEKRELEHAVGKWSRAFLASPDCVFLVHLDDGRVGEVNDRFTALLGYDRAAVVGKTMDELAFWPPSPCRERFVTGLREDGAFDNAEVNFHTATGEPIPVLVSARVTEVDGRRVVVTNARDVSEKKRQERAVRKSEARLRRTQRLAGLGTWELDPATGAVYWSEETFRIAGLEPADEPPGFDEYLHTVHPDDRAKLMAALDAAGKGAGGDDGAGGFELEVRHRRPDGTFNRVLTRGEPIRDDHGRVIELFGSVLDLSGRDEA